MAERKLDIRYYVICKEVLAYLAPISKMFGPQWS